MMVDEQVIYIVRKLRNTEKKTQDGTNERNLVGKHRSIKLAG